MSFPSDGGPSGPPSGDSPGAQDTTYHAKGHAWWPQGDPGKLRAAADAWDAAAGGIDRVAGDGDAAMRSVSRQNSGDAIDQFVAFWGRYSGGAADGGDGPALTEAAAACRQIAHVCRDYADGIERTRHEIEALVAAAAATMVIGVALTILTAGASDAAAMAAEEALAAEAAALETTLAETIATVVRTAIAGALKGAAFSMAYDTLIVQPIEMHFEPGRHFSIDEVGDWGLEGLAFGAAFEGGVATIRALRMARMLKVQPVKSTGTALARELGRAGEAQVPGAGNTRRIYLTGGRYRIPDILDEENKALGEVKNVRRLSFTRQFRDYADYAEAHSYEFNLYVRESTKLTAPLMEAIEDGLIQLKPVLTE